MDGTENSGRRPLLGAFAIAFAAAVAWPSAAAAQEPLVPDLIAQPLVPGETVAVYEQGGATVLDVGFRVENIGAGPLELEPLPEPDPATDCDGDGDTENDRPERQNVYLDDGDGVYERDVDVLTQARGDGCSVFHQGHNHWHAAVMNTELLAAGTGELFGQLDKLNYCLADSEPSSFDLPGFDEDKAYDGALCSIGGTQGISIGWFDRYWIYTSGQQIDVTDVPAGTYCVRQTVDSISSIDELSENNNVTKTRIYLDPAAGAASVLSMPCPGSDPLSGDPDTVLLHAPPKRLKTNHRDAFARFEFVADDPDARLECALDGADFVPCASRGAVRLRAHRGRWTSHAFEIRAVDGSGHADASPAGWSGKVKRRSRHG